MKKLNVGIIGLGVGEQHIDGYRRHIACEVKALCDFSDEKIEWAKQKYPGMRIVKEAAEIIENPDINIISVASYDNYHYEQVLSAVTHNKHVFVEKPVCLHERELVHIREVLRERPHIKISSNLILRRCPRFLNLKTAIQEGAYGSLFYVEADYNYGRIQKITEGWRGKVEDYSVVHGGAIHMVDLLLWLTGDEVSEVAAFGTNIATQGTQFQYNDTVVSLLKFKSGIIGKVGANFSCVLPHFHHLAIFGTKKTFINGRPNALVYESRDPEREPVEVRTPYPGYDKGDLIYSFVQSIVDGTEAEITKDDVFKAMSVCLAIEKAQAESGIATVKYISED
ncbi:MAG: Gfo/Idh/MocA family protein [Candidatus Thorarchaeota archaeon]|jgi:predicted dehydrogenase